MTTETQSTLQRIAFYCACASAITDIVSIAACQILLGISLAALLASRVRWRVPPIFPAFCLFVLGTLVSWAASGQWHTGFPQIKKFYVWLLLFALYNTVRTVDQVRWLYWTAALTATVNAAWALRQYVLKTEEAERLGRDFYEFYIANRIIGFQNHWMTFSGISMVVLLLLGGLLLWAPLRRWNFLFWLFAIVIAMGIVLSDTRGVWGAVGAGMLYLVATWRPKLLLLAPLVLAAVFFAAPSSVQRRVESIYNPNKMDSNQFRYVTRRTGWEMIKAHPWLGVGPQLVGRNFDAYMPADLPRPKPSGYYEHLHNIYIHFAAERGIPTMLALMWIIGQALYQFFQAARGSSSNVKKAVLHGCVAVLLAILVEGFAEVNVGDSEVLALFVTVLACGYIAIASKEPVDA